MPAFEDLERDEVAGFDLPENDWEDGSEERPIEEYVDLAEAPAKASSTLNALSAFQRAADRFPPLNADQQLELCAVYRTGEAAAIRLTEPRVGNRQRAQLEADVLRGQYAMEHLCASCWRLAWLIVREQAEARFGRDRAMPMLEELMAEANSALVAAVKQFDPTMTPKFATYAGQVVRNHIRAVLSREGYMRLAPSWNRVKRMAVALVPELTVQLGRHPSTVELQEALMARCLEWADAHLTDEQRNLPADQRHAARMSKLKKQGMLGAIRDIDDVLTASQAVGSLDAVVGDHGGATVGDLVANPDDGRLFDDIEHGELRAAILAALNSLSEREREIVLLRFGFIDGESWTYAKIAERHDVTAERIRQIERAALKKLESPHGQFAGLGAFLPSQIDADIDRRTGR